MELKVAVIQVSPEYYNLNASMLKAETYIREAAENGANIITLGETWLSGYPAWLDFCPDIGLWDHEPTKEVYAMMANSSIVVPGNETQKLCTLAKELEVTLIISCNEKIIDGPGNGTLYNTLLIINEKGELANHHRKLVPTFTEKLVWGAGDANGIRSVNTKFGKIGGLICWEHWMPIPRQILHNSGEAIHISVWPTAHEMVQVAARHYAFEGRCFVLVAGSILKAKDLPDILTIPHELKSNPDKRVLRGGSAVIGPNGSYIAEPLYDKEAIIYADIDLDKIKKEQLSLDTSGHYARPDLFKLEVRSERLL